jgi:hypothetical protein
LSRTLFGVIFTLVRLADDGRSEMEELHKTHKDVPYGWLLVAAAVAQWIGKVLRANPSVHDERAAALEVGLNRLSSPH